MQMHPDNLNGYGKEEILSLLKLGYIGIDIDSDYATTLGVNDKPFTEWGSQLQIYDETHNSWDKQISSFLNLKKNDIVLVRHGEKFIALVKIIGNYQFQEIENIWFRHMYPIEILSTYHDFSEEYKIPKAQGTFEISKTGQTFKIVNEIYSKTIKGKNMQEKINLLKNRKQIILQGPPGTGKTRLAKQMAIHMINKNDPIKTNNEIKASLNKISKDQIKLIQFHPSYSYEDFVRGIVAKTVLTSTNGYIEYIIENKVLAQMAKEAKEDLEKNGESANKYILIIDEINRANLSSVLGELIYALEYRDEAVESMYEHPTDGRKIILPSNLYIIGTMNTADRSIGHIDYAIRRRFAFDDVLPDKSEADKNSKFKDVELLFKDINGKRAKTLSPEFEPDRVMLGHSYFIGDKDELEKKLKYQVIPLLREYVSDGVLTDEAISIIDTL
jgi:broad-specificity NMP kinase